MSSTPRIRRRLHSVGSEERARTRRMMWLFGGGALLLVLVGAGSWFSLRQLRASQLLEMLHASKAHLEAGDFPEAARLLTEARRTAPQNTDVIRAIADFQIHSKASPVDVAQTLKLLADRPGATDDDLVKLARAEMQQGAVDAAQLTIARLPEAIRDGAEVIELEATMLKLEGRHQEAEARLRTAMLAKPGNPEAALKLAVLDYKQALPELHRHGRECLWKIASTGDEAAARAIQLLAKDAQLTGEEAARLADFALAHSSPGDARFAALGALTRLRPHERAAMIERERVRVATRAVQERQAFAIWLSSIGGHEHLQTTLTAQTSVKDKDLPPDQFRLKLEALAEAKRWHDLSLMLTRDAEKVLGTTSFHLWQARLVAHKEHDEAGVRRHLDLAFDAAVRDNNMAAALLVAETAARLAAPGHAASFYEEIAARQKSSPRARVDLLEKAFALHAKVHDTSAMLGIAQEVAELSPANRPAAFRSDYLALLAGESLEVIADRVQNHVGHDASQRLLLRALAAHRLRQPVPEAAALKKLKTSALPAGQRAVLAAMIASTGDASTAFEIVERISKSLLLPEEAKLLSLAR